MASVSLPVVLPAPPAAGAGSGDLIPYLDADFIDRNPTPFVRYSGNAPLHHFLLSAVGLVSYCGYTSLRYLLGLSGPFAETLDCFRDAVMAGADLDCRPVSGVRAARAGSRDRLSGAARAGSGRCLAGHRAPTRDADWRCSRSASGINASGSARPASARRQPQILPARTESTARRRAMTTTESALARLCSATGQALAIGGKRVLR